MEGRLTICNMSIEAGARAGLIAPDDDDVRVPRGPSRRAEGADWERGARPLARAADRRRRRLRPRARDRRLGARPAGHVGHESRAWSCRSTASSPIPADFDDADDARRRRARARVHGARARDADPRDRGRPRLHRLVHELADRGPARRRRGRARAPRASVRARDGRAGLGAGEAAGRGRGPRPRSSTTPASSGAAPAARCASA